MAGAKAEAEGEREQDQGGQADQEHLSGIQLLEINGGMETKAGKGPKGQAVREGENSPVQEAGGGNAAGSCLYKAEPDTERLDKLLPNRQHEGVAERRFRPVDAAQGESSDTQTVEETEDDLQKYDVAEHQNALQHDLRGHLQSGKFPLGAVPEGGAQCGELLTEPESAGLAQ